MTNEQFEKINKNLEAIKKLLIAQLLVQGLGSQEIGSLLNVDSSTIRRMISIKKVKQKSQRSRIKSEDLNEE